MDLWRWTQLILITTCGYGCWNDSNFIDEKTKAYGSWITYLRSQSEKVQSWRWAQADWFQRQAFKDCALILFFNMLLTLALLHFPHLCIPLCIYSVELCLFYFWCADGDHPTKSLPLLYTIFNLFQLSCSLSTAWGIFSQWIK